MSLSKCRQGRLPKFLCEYLHSQDSNPQPETLLKDVRFTVYDTETTGLDVHKDRLLSIGAVSVTSEAIHVQDTFYVVVQSEYFDAKAAPIHGLTRNEVHQGSGLTPALQGFLQMAEKSVWVAHHASFDVRMIENEIRRSYDPRFYVHNPVLDTVYLAIKLEKPDARLMYIDRNAYTLDALLERYNIVPEDRHTSWGDAYLTGRLLQIFLKKFIQQGSVYLKDIQGTPRP